MNHQPVRLNTWRTSKLTSATLVVLCFFSGACVPAAPSIPPDSTLKSLTQTTMLDFALAVKGRDFSAFHSHVSSAWRDQITVAQLNQAFKVFWEQKMDLTIIQGHTPQFTTQPKIDQDQLLILEGKYLVENLSIEFNLSYTLEDDTWKLFGIHVNAFPASEAPVEDIGLPSREDLFALTQATMLDFALAVKAKDFTAFHKKIAVTWQKQTTKEDLTEIFRSFLDQNIDLTALQDLTPAFTEEPQLNDRGWLILKGAYPTQPSEVTFSLKYILEQETWKLVGINVQVR